MLTARRVQKPHDPVAFHAFQLSRVLISYSENFGRIVAIMRDRYEGRRPVPCVCTRAKDYMAVGGKDKVRGSGQRLRLDYHPPAWQSPRLATQRICLEGSVSVRITGLPCRHRVTAVKFRGPDARSWNRCR